MGKIIEIEIGKHWESEEKISEIWEKDFHFKKLN